MPWARTRYGVNGPMARSMRQAAGLSRAQLAALMGVCRQRIDLLEVQGWMRPDTVVRLQAALQEGERRGRQWLPKYKGYYESANDSEPPDYITQRLIRARQKEAERQRRYRAKRKASALEVLAVIDGAIGPLMFKLQRQYGEQAQATAERIHELRRIRQLQERIFRRGGYLRESGP